MNGFKKLCAVALSAAVAVTAVGPANALMLPSAASVSQTSPLIDVQYRSGEFRRDGDRAFFKGYRGHRDRRPDHRFFNGFWFPLAAFGIGALIGSGIANSRPSYSYHHAHVAWCYDRYRSYREWDNSWQPYHGPRQICYSPYG
jgi:hypothetical protein